MKQNVRALDERVVSEVLKVAYWNVKHFLISEAFLGEVHLEAVERIFSSKDGGDGVQHLIFIDCALLNPKADENHDGFLVVGKQKNGRSIVVGNTLGGPYSVQDMKGNTLIVV